MKHTWMKDKDTGEDDEFAFDTSGDPEGGIYHNGPICSVCGFSFCHHCDPNGWDDDTCPGPKLVEDNPVEDDKIIGVISLSSIPTVILLEQATYKTLEELKTIIRKGIYNSEKNLL